MEMTISTTLFHLDPPLDAGEVRGFLPFRRYSGDTSWFLDELAAEEPRTGSDHAIILHQPLAASEWTPASRQREGLYFVWVETTAGAERVTSRTNVRSSLASEVDNIMHAFSLNVSEMADILGVSRQSIYKWKDGARLRRKDLKQRVRELAFLAGEWNGRSSLPVGEALHVLDRENGMSLFDVLKNNALPVERTRAMLERLADTEQFAWAEADALMAEIATDDWQEVPSALRLRAERDERPET